MPTLRPSAALLATTIMLSAVVFAMPAHALTLLTEENPPFNYTENGKLTGLVTELVLETVKRANMSFTVEVLPWTRAYMRTQAEKDTCLFATARLENREKLFTWVGPFASNLWSVYGRGDFAGSVRLLVDLKPYRIGGVVNDAKVEYLRENGITNLRQALEDRSNPPRLFLPAEDPNRIDLWVTGFFGARDVAKAAKVADTKLVFVVRDIPLYLACSPQTAPSALKALNEGLEKVRADGLPARLAAAYEKKFAQ
ncbi:MAG: transporter substrate-binding domain-containing protein [Casimicrobiaceae bacterium]